MSIIIFAILYLVIFVSFIILIYFKWIIKTIREIASSKNSGGYLKLTQFLFLVPLILLFVMSYFYFWINDEKVSPIQIIFTVIVGWLGFILARVFSEKAMQMNYEEKSNMEQMQNTITAYRDEVTSSEEIIAQYAAKTRSLMNYIKKLKNQNKSRK